MKRITFTKLGRYGARPDFPGYLLLHEAHPGREFVIARGSKTQRGNRAALRMTNEWYCFDRGTGLPVRMDKLRDTRGQTRG